MIDTDRQNKKAGGFLALHRASTILIFANARDAISARIFEVEGFKAIAALAALRPSAAPGHHARPPLRPKVDSGSDGLQHLFLHVRLLDYPQNPRLQQPRPRSRIYEPTRDDDLGVRVDCLDASEDLFP
jgi:hypothetical protein